MRSRMKHILSKADIVLFIILILIAAVGIILLSGSGSGETAVVRLDGEIIKQVSLDVDQTFYINNVCIQVKDGAIAIIESDCPTQACVKTGWLNTPESDRSVFAKQNFDYRTRRQRGGCDCGINFP